MLDVANADFLLSSDDSLHKIFDVKTYSGGLDRPETEELLKYFRSESLAIQTLSLAYSTNVTVNVDGTVDLYVLREDISNYWRAKIISVCEEGYYSKYWMVDTGQNEKQLLGPGETLTLPAGTKFDASPVYDVVPPQPEPTPTPTEEVAAQTGDSAPLVPFVLLAVLAGGVLLYTRKASQK